MTLIEAYEEVQKLEKEMNAYLNGPKKTKAASKRIRTSLGVLKRETADLRRQLLEEDKQGGK